MSAVAELFGDTEQTNDSVAELFGDTKKRVAKAKAGPAINFGELEAGSAKAAIDRASVPLPVAKPAAKKRVKNGTDWEALQVQPSARQVARRALDAAPLVEPQGNIPEAGSREVLANLLTGAAGKPIAAAAKAVLGGVRGARILVPAAEGVAFNTMYNVAAGTPRGAVDPSNIAMNVAPGVVSGFLGAGLGKVRGKPVEPVTPRAVEAPHVVPEPARPVVAPLAEGNPFAAIPKAPREPAAVKSLPAKPVEVPVITPIGLKEQGHKFPWQMTIQERIERMPLPEQPQLPQEGSFPVIMTDDGGIYVGTKPHELHQQIIQHYRLPLARVVDGGRIENGVVEAWGGQGDANRLGKQAREALKAEQIMQVAKAYSNGTEIPASVIEDMRSRGALTGDSPLLRQSTSKSPDAISTPTEAPAIAPKREAAKQPWEQFIGGVRYVDGKPQLASDADIVRASEIHAGWGRDVAGAVSDYKAGIQRTPTRLRHALSLTNSRVQLENAVKERLGPHMVSNVRTPLGMLDDLRAINPELFDKTLADYPDLAAKYSKEVIPNGEAQGLQEAVGGGASKRLQKLDELEAAARARLQEHIGGTGGFIGIKGAPKGGGKIPSPKLVADYAEIGAIKIARGVVKFADWAVEMAKEVPGITHVQLRRVWKASNKHYRDILKLDIDAIDDVGMRFVKALKIARQAEPIKAEMFAGQRAKQAAVLASVRDSAKYSDLEASKVAKGAMKGAFERPELDLGTNWTPNDMAELKARLRNSTKLTNFEWLNAEQSLTDLLELGKQPEPRMYAVLGREFGPAFVKGLESHTPFYIRALKRTWIEGNGLFRAALTTADNSWNLMQGQRVIFTAPKIWAKGVAKSTRALFSEEFAQKAEADMRAHPLYDSAVRDGLALHDVGVEGAVSLRPDEWVATLVKKIPILGKIPRASERAYQTAANTVRFDLYKKTVNLYDALAKDQASLGNKIRFGQAKTLTQQQRTAVAKEINAWTGWGSYGKAESAAAIIGAPFFSLRNLTSQIESPFYMFHPDPVVRRIAAKHWAQFTGLATATMFAAKQMGADVETDMRSSDFAKIKVGKTRVDITGGYGLILRYLAQFYTGKRKTQTGEIMDAQRTDLVGRFARSKLSPLLGNTWSAIERENMVGEPFDAKNWGAVVRNSLTPMIIQDMMDAAEQEGLTRAAWVGPMTFFGQRIQTYAPKPQKVTAPAGIGTGFKAIGESSRFRSIGGN